MVASNGGMPLVAVPPMPAPVDGPMLSGITNRGKPPTLALSVPRIPSHR
jgi:hypothetical protein